MAFTTADAKRNLIARGNIDPDAYDIHLEYVRHTRAALVPPPARPDPITDDPPPADRTKKKRDRPEGKFQTKVINLAHANGWLVHHVAPARVNGRMMTAIRDADAGFPDLVLAKGGRLLIRELKTDTTYPNPAQRMWGDMLVSSGTDYRVWRPRDWADIEATLTST